MDQVDDFGPESHSTDFEEKSKNTRASGSTSFSLHDYGLRTEIAFGTKDYSGKSIEYPMAEQLHTMRKWHSRIRVGTAKERRLSNVLSKITETCSAMSLPKSITETAAMLYRNFENKCEAKGKSILCMAAAAIYLACKRCGVVRSLDEIIKATGSGDSSNLRLASRYYRIMVMETGVFTIDQREQTHLTENKTVGASNTIAIQNFSNQAPEISYGQYGQQQQQQITERSSRINLVDRHIARLTSMARIDTRVERLALDIAFKTDAHLVDGKAPIGIAAAYIYLASVLLGYNILQRDLSSLAGVSEVTIRNRLRDILSNLKLTLKVKSVTSR
jgi:transcription initiation factor TFIIB